MRFIWIREWLGDCLTQWLGAWVNECVSECVIVLLGDLLIQTLADPDTHCACAWVRERMSEYMIGFIDTHSDKWSLNIERNVKKVALFFANKLHNSFFGFITIVTGNN